MSNGPQFDVSITLIRRKENIDQYRVISTYFFDVILTSEKLT